MSDYEQGVYVGLMEAACLLYEEHGPFWRPSKYRKAYRKIMAFAKSYRERAMQRAKETP